MSTVKISDIFSPINLQQVYEKNIRDSKVTGLDNLLPALLPNSELDVCLRKFKSQNYQFTNYKEQLFSKGANKYPRSVSIATARDRVILKVLQEYLMKKLPECVTPLPQSIISDIQTALNQNQSTHFIRTDIKAFYDNINHDKLIQQLKRKIKSKKVLSLISNLISTPTTPQRKSKSAISKNLGVPQGLSVSNILAESYLSILDEAMRKELNISYFRYVDDILIICPSIKSGLSTSCTTS